MLRLGNEILAFTRTCEHLLSEELRLTDDELNLVSYYINELRRKFQTENRLAYLSCKPGM